MKFLLVGQAGSYNLGCEAIVRTTITMIQKEFKNPEVYISAFDYENEKLIKFGCGVKIIPAFSEDLWKRLSRDWFVRLAYKLLGKDKAIELKFSPIIPYLKKADVVISIGGDNYTMDYGFPEYFIDLNNIVKSKGKKLVIWGASVGPFLNDKNLEIIRECLLAVDLINVRESSSIEYLKGLGIEANVKFVADPAFLLPTKSVDLLNLVTDNTCEFLGVNVSPILSDYKNKGDSEEIVNETVKFLKRIIDEKKMHILLIPHVIKNNSFNNDYEFMGKIFNKLENTEMITRIMPSYDAMQMKDIISKCRFFIGARTHATIAALSSGVPTICLGYSMKAKGINEDIFGNQDWLVDINNFSEAKIYDIKKMSYQNILNLKELL